MAEDFKQFLLGIMLGILSRSPSTAVPIGQYQFAVARGDLRRIGNERAIRQNGLPVVYRDSIVTRVQDRLATLDVWQTAAVAALCDYYEREVYTPTLAADATGAELERKGFASAMAAEAKRELRSNARRKGMTEGELGRATGILLERLPYWACAVSESDADAYVAEVRIPEDEGQPRLKFVFKPEMLESGRLVPLFPEAASVPVVSSAMEGGSSMPPPIKGIPIPAYQYFIGINGNPVGPHPAQVIVQMVQSGQIDPANTKIWRQGLADWIILRQLVEIQALLQAGVQMMPPPLN